MNNDELRKEYTFCRICESLCGLEVEMKGNEVVQVFDKDSYEAMISQQASEEEAQKLVGVWTLSHAYYTELWHFW